MTARKPTKKDLEEQLKRARADYVNLQKRLERERDSVVNLAALSVVSELLPVLDNLEKAAAALADDGLKLTVKEFKNILYKQGLEEIETEGKMFNGEEHEAVDVVEGEQDGKVVEVLRKGYRFKGVVIRPAQVRVTRKDTD